jgi:chemotaxis protein MotB
MSSGRARRVAVEDFYVTLNDALVGILFLFILLLMNYAVTFKRHDERLNARDRVFSERFQQRSTMLTRIARGMPGAHAIPADGVLRLNADLLFEQNKADLSSAGHDALGKLARLLQRELPCRVAESPGLPCNGARMPILEAVYIEGHTDRLPVRSGKYRDNWELSSARAIAAFRALTNYGSDSQKSPLEALRNARKENVIGVSGYADTRPISRDDPLNRRVDFRFVLSAPSDAELAAVPKER